jgi:hypothetical protein
VADTTRCSLCGGRKVYRELFAFAKTAHYTQPTQANTGLEWATRPKQFMPASYACVAGFALKMPAKLSRYCRKTRIHNTQATSAGAMVPGAIVRWNARML